MKKIILLSVIGIFVLASCKQQVQKETKEVVIDEQLAEVPDWAKEVVWYQIFPERFRNGDPTNDPRPQDIEGCYPGFVPDGWTVTPWTHDWYKDDPWFPETEGGKDFTGNPITNFGQKSQLRRYGGDLQGVFDQLDYLDSLGVTAIYFNPLNDAPSLHKYDARHWRHIDRNFGPDPDRDIEIMAAEEPANVETWQMTTADSMFVALVDEMHKRGMKVIMDFSWNHTGHTCWAWKDVVEKGEESQFKDWYWVESFDDPETPENEFKYHGWFGVYDLPEIRETQFADHSNGIRVMEGDIYDPAAKEHIMNVTRRWLDPNGDGDPSDGVDGFRLDVAAEIPLGFWRDYRKEVRKINPEAYLVGEVWWEAWPDKLLDPKPFLQGDVFDAVMNYRWYRAARHFFNQSPDEIPVSEFVDSLKRFASNLPEASNYAMMNLTASHDAPRVSTSLYNKNMYKMHAKPADDPNYKINKPDKETYDILKMLLAQQFSFVGAPHIWAGDEMGMWGADDPSTRKPLIWPDYEFETETTHPTGLERPADKVEFNHALFDIYRNFIALRTANPVLSNGELEYLIVDDEKKSLAYSRFDAQDEIIAVFNNSDQLQKLEIPLKQDKQYRDILNALAVNQAGQKLEIEMPPHSCAWLAAEK